MKPAILLLIVLAGWIGQPAGLAQSVGGQWSEAQQSRIAWIHARSLALREAALRKTIAKDTCWPHGVWGDNLWALSALFLNEKTDEANARLLGQARAYLARRRAGEADPAFLPEKPTAAPWTYFSLTDYVRTLCLFGGKQPRFPGRLKAETEAAMKEALWLWVSADSRLANAGPEDLLLLLGTENHDLCRRPNHYLVTSLLMEDPAFKERRLADGHLISEHAAAYAAFFREWPRRRAASGLWVEVGSNTYQKYSWPALFNLHELAPDPVVRHRFGLLLDLAFIEEAQISVRGVRGGGRSRGEPGANGFESYKNLFHAVEGRPAGSSHSRVMETSRYQLPAAAILLAERTVPPERPFVIRNRVLGELEGGQSPGDGGQRFAADSALVNYAYRTPHYVLGSTLQDPSLSLIDPAKGLPTLRYAGISRQNRACGLLFDDPAAARPGGIHVIIGHPGGGRPQHSFWSVQHENVLLVQRIAGHGRSTLGSYNTGRIGIRFAGDLTKTESGGWIFATNGRAFAGVRFLDGGHQWDERMTEANPAVFSGAADTSRILIHAGDATSHPSFEAFQQDLLANPPLVTGDRIDYRFGVNRQRIEMMRYDVKSPGRFTLPRVNGLPIDLRPDAAYEGPYLNGAFGGDRITVSVGPLRQVLDFSGQGD